MNALQNQTVNLDSAQLKTLAEKIRGFTRALGFQQVGVTDIELADAATRLRYWLDKGYQGEMAWMAQHAHLRSHPDELVPGTLRIISVRMDYLPPGGEEPFTVLNSPELGYVSRYALGRDYHKLMRRRLQKLADRIHAEIGPFGYRAFVDSAPVLEKALAEKAGLGWVGKHSNVINQHAGSWFFLGELFTDLPLPVDPPAENHCGRCQVCIDICPTQAIAAPYTVDARRCISYLTIEHPGPIPEPLRPLLGNRIYGCDDCQLVCPWNRFAVKSEEADYKPRHALDAPHLLDLFAWDEATFLKRTEGSAIRRIGHERWLRNIAVALGNASMQPAIISALEQRLNHPSALVREHVEWALARHKASAP